MIIYSDLENRYQMLDYPVTHSRLLIRSMKNKNRDYNIDILFKPVDFLLIPDIFYGIEISICESNEIAKYLIDKYGFKVTTNYKIFSIKNADGKYFYINAMAVGVFHNELEPNESSIKGLDGEFGEKQIWYIG